jgi:hypothetical protein
MVTMVISTRIVARATRHLVAAGTPSRNSAPKLLNPLPDCVSEREESDLDVQPEASRGVAACREGWDGGLSGRAAAEGLSPWYDECVRCHAELVWDGEKNHIQGSGVPIPAKIAHLGHICSHRSLACSYRSLASGVARGAS